MKIAMTAIMAVAAAGSWFVAPWLPAALAPAAACAAALIWAAASPREEELSELKPGGARGKARGVSLAGSWEARFNGGEWVAARVPADVATVAKGLRTIRKIEYRRRVEFPALKSGQRMFLVCDGMGGTADIFIGGERAAASVFGFVAVEIDITEAVGGENAAVLRIVIKAPRASDNPGGCAGMAPPFAGGVYGDIRVEVRDRASIACVSVRAADGKDIIDFELEGETGSPSAVAYRVEGVSGVAAAATGELLIPPFRGVKVASVELAGGSLPRWTPESPTLCRVTASLICEDIRHTVTVDTAARGIEASDGRVVGEGGEARLRGIRRSANYPPYGAGAPAWACANDVRSIKEMGLNAVYCDGMPPGEDFLSACDRAGLCVIADFPWDAARRSAGEAEANLARERAGRAARAHPSLLCFTGEPLCVETVRFDLWRDGAAREAVEAFGGRHGALALDFIDTRGGRDDRRLREMRKTSADATALKAADSAGVSAFFVGSLFTWGISQGALSINRQKKSSVEAIKEYLRSGGMLEPARPAPPLNLPLRAVPILAAVLALALIAYPASREFFFAAPQVFMCFHGPLTAAALAVAMLVAFSFSAALLTEWNRGWLPGAAPSLGFRTLLALQNSFLLRAGLAAAAQAYLFYVGVVAMSAAEGASLSQTAWPAMLSTFSWGAAMPLLFVSIEPILVVVAAAAIGFIYLLWFSPAPVAALYILVQWLPWAVLFFKLKRRDIFRVRSRGR
jgi:hypothetical protein